MFKVRDNKAIYLAIGINLSGLKKVLGLWIGAVVLKCWFYTFSHEEMR